MALEYRIVSAVCPTCGATASKVIRRAVDTRSAVAAPAANEVCFRCLLAKETPHGKAYFIRQWRMMWSMAGGALEDMPDAIRVKGDPQRRTPAVAGTPPPRRAFRPVQPRGSDTPTWASPVAVLPSPPPLRYRPRVLWVTHDFSATGAPTLLLNFLPHMRGMDSALHSLGDGPLRQRALDAGVRIVDHFAPADYDLVVCNTLATHSAARLAIAAGVRTMLWCHEWSYETWMKGQELQELARALSVLVYAHPAQRDSYSLLKGIRSRVVPSPIPPFVAEDRQAARAALGIDADAFHVVSFGRNEPRKGQQDFQALANLPGVEVHLIHGDPQPKRWLSAADLYVATSRAEVCPLSVQEAKMAGLAALATNIPAHADMIVPGRNGYLYEPGDLETLRELTLRLKENAVLRRELASSPAVGPRWDESVAMLEALVLSEGGSGAATADDLHVVYHVAGMGPRWREIVTEQLAQLAEAGLHTVLITHCGEGLAWLSAKAKELRLNAVVAEHHDSVLCFEQPAMRLIERLAQASDRPVLYLHTKGASYESGDSIMHDWRRLLTTEMICYWRRHLETLYEYDAVGVNWWTATGKQHFSGNMWMASAPWLRKLPDFSGYYRDRYSCERWIGSVEGCRAKSLLCTDAAFWDRDRDLVLALCNAQKARIERRR